MYNCFAKVEEISKELSFNNVMSKHPMITISS